MWQAAEMRSGWPESTAPVALGCEGVDGEKAGQKGELDAALALLEQGRPNEADRILTAMTLERPRDGMVWLAAGICRLHRGRVRAAVAAFRMSSWLTDDSLARELLVCCESTPD